MEDLKSISLLQRLNEIIGVISGASLGTAIGVNIVRFHFGRYSVLLIVSMILVGALAGFLIARRSPPDLIASSPGVAVRKVLEAMVAAYHLGTVILLVSLLAWNLDERGWWYYGHFGRVSLETAVLGYAFLRLWVFFHSLWSRFAKTEPLSFVGLYLGTFPTLIYAMRGPESLSWLFGVLAPIGRLLSIPGYATDLFVLSSDPFWAISAFVLCTSLGWALIFFIVEWFTLHRKARQPT